MTVDEIRARYSDLRNCDTQIWQDFDYLLKENTRLRTALAPQPDAQQDECNRYNWRRTAELETIVDLVKAMADLGYGTPEHRSAHYAVLKAIESDALATVPDAPQPDNAIPTQSVSNFNAIAAEKE